MAYTPVFASWKQSWRLSHLISEEKPSASHMCVRISLHTYDRCHEWNIHKQYSKRIRFSNFITISLLHSDDRLEGLKLEQTITRRSISVFNFHTHLTGGSHPQNSSYSLKYSSPLFSSEQRVSKGEYTYSWYSASGERCKVIKDRLRLTAVSILMLVKFY